MPQAMVSAFHSRGWGGSWGVGFRRACFYTAWFACPGLVGWAGAIDQQLSALERGREVFTELCHAGLGYLMRC